MVLNITNTPLSITSNSMPSFGLNNLNVNKNNSSAYYAKKGEPMYIKDMDGDEDGVITFDEFRDYCKANDISKKDMIKMLDARMAYHMSKDREKAERKAKEEDSQNKTTEFVYAKEGDTQYDERMDYNNDGQVTYKEYLEYCKEHSKQKQEKSNTVVDENNPDEFKTINVGEVLNTYSDLEGGVLEYQVECEA